MDEYREILAYVVLTCAGDGKERKTDGISYFERIQHRKERFIHPMSQEEFSKDGRRGGAKIPMWNKALVSSLLLVSTYFSFNTVNTNVIFWGDC